MTEKIIDFIQSLTPEEAEAAQKFALANRGSKMDLSDYRNAVNIFRMENVKDGRSLEERLATATSDEEKGKILSEAGLNPLTKNDAMNNYKVGARKDVNIEVEHTPKDMRGGSGAFDPVQRDEVAAMLEKVQRDNANSPVSVAMDLDEKYQKQVNRFSEVRE